MPLTTLTQGHLKLLDLCPRRFQYAYLEHLAAPTDPQILERQQWGTRFHLVMQQRELGLSTDEILAQHPDLAAAVEAMMTTAPDLFQPFSRQDGDPDTGWLRQSEHRRTVALAGYELTVVYDLLMLTPTEGRIIDWKTYQHLPDAANLAQDWQTRLYRYVLAETTALAPEQITMTYWFVPPPSVSGDRPQPRQITLPYAAAEHRRTGRDLHRRIATLTTLLDQRADQAEAFPQVEATSGLCDRCPFAIRCQRAHRQEPPNLAALPAVEAIAEVPI